MSRVCVQKYRHFPAKADYERKERAKELSRQKGEGTWMLPALSDRIDREQEEMQNVKRKKKKTKKKKGKKEKKKKKKKSDSSSSSESEPNDESEPMWVEKTNTTSKPKEQLEVAGVVKGPKLERDSWMTEAPGFFPCTSRGELREQKRKEKEEREVAVMDQMGQHERELNPYWKDGGTGVPEEDPSKKKVSSASFSIAGDGGVSWLRKAYQRCVERAKDEGTSLEDVAAEQYGSLEKLHAMIAEAEEKAGLRRYRQRDQHDDGRRRSRSRERRDRSRSRDRDERWKRRRSTSRERYRDRRRDSRERDSPHRYRHRSRSKERNRDRSRSRERSRHDRNRSRSPVSSSRLKGLSSRFMKPGDMDTSSTRSRRSPERSSSWRKKGFMKPGDARHCPPRRHSPDRRKSRHESSSSSDSSSDSEDERPRKKFAFSKPKDDSDDENIQRRRDVRKAEGQPRWKKPSNQAVRETETVRKDSSSESESESASSEFGSESSPEINGAKEEPAVVIMTEDEMNKLGAKIMKAELMGNQAMADKLKAQLEAMRNAKKTAGINTTAAAERKQQKDEKEENVVVLTRTDRAGNVRPLVDLDDAPSGGKGKKRRKKKSVQTHGNKGERERYFDDDDKYDLKSMVAREKLSTAEDANMMFARLAGRGIERTDDDHQVDDVFMSRAAGMQSEAKVNEREKLASIMESKKIQGAMEKCHFCFENIPKHLIIAIGLKVYLCLPGHRSMADGHCLIIPMQHVTSGTQVDEDVWAEIQIFRKGLTRMFADNDEDVVFMETSMHLRRHPHMVMEVIPMPKEVGDMAPIYFKKAIMETGSEWAQNKKVVDLSQKDVRSAVPKGFPYFSVEFGLQGGFAHVIEEEKDFPGYFGREICGGMMELGPELWRKPHKENFDSQREKVLKFAKMWKPYDWTQKLKAKKEEEED